MIISTKNLDELAQSLAAKLKDGDVVTLSGPLAAGKTTLVKAIVKAMGYQGTVTSPTFLLERRYPVSYHGTSTIIHLDFYRLEPEQLKSFDWSEQIGQGGTITFIEWPELIRKDLPDQIKTLKLEIIDEDSRQLTVSENFDQ